MRELWPVYHREIPPLLRELAAAPAMERLAQVGMNCGCEYTAFPRFARWLPYSRLDHSMGVGLIVWHFTADPAQAAAGLLHDIATPVFAHVVDFLNGDHVRQESTEDRTAAMIAASPELQTVLRHNGLTTEAVSDYHRYPIADNDSPRLSADRLEYTLGDLLCYGFAGLDRLRTFYQDLTTGPNEDGTAELMFRSGEAARAFMEGSLQVGRVSVSDEDRFAMQALADLLRQALDRGVITGEDLYTTEPQVIAQLQADRLCAAQWARFRGYCRLRRAKDRPETGRWLRVPAKLRCIDPIAHGMGRVSRWDRRLAEELAAFRQTDFNWWLAGEVH